MMVAARPPRRSRDGRGPGSCPGPRPRRTPGASRRAPQLGFRRPAATCAGPHLLTTHRSCFGPGWDRSWRRYQPRPACPSRWGRTPRCSTRLDPGRTRDPDPTVRVASGLACGQPAVVESWQGGQHRGPQARVLAEGNNTLGKDQVLQDEGVPRHRPHQDLQGFLGQVAPLSVVGPAAVVEAGEAPSRTWPLLQGGRSGASGNLHVRAAR